MIAYNLSCAAGVLAGGKLAKARTSNDPGQADQNPRPISSTARTYTLHLPTNSRREAPFMAMFDAVQVPPEAA